MASLGAYVDILEPASSARFECDGADLHYETWEPAAGAAPRGTLFHAHGVCESNHTVTVQRLARASVDRGWRLVSLEHEGHGLSSGARAVCGDLDRLVDHFQRFVAARLVERPADEAWALSGHSMGTVVALYAFCRGLRDACAQCRGLVLLAPAVGVDARAVPPPLVVSALRVASFLAPQSSFSMTPREEPRVYAVPADSDRNFCGFWPLATSRMLLDTTSGRVARDLESGALRLGDGDRLLVVHGKQDYVVPIRAVADFVKAAGKPLQDALRAVPKAGHDLTVDPATGEAVCAQALAFLADAPPPSKAT